MKKVFRITITGMWLLAFVLTHSLLGNATFMKKEVKRGMWNAQEIKYVDREILFMIKNGQDPADVKSYLAKNNLNLTRELDRFGFGKVSLRLGLNIFPVIKRMQKTGFFLYVEPNMIDWDGLHPNDPDYLASKQWGLNNVGQNPLGGARDADIDAPEAWNQTTVNSNIIVSVLDSGISGNTLRPNDPEYLALKQWYLHNVGQNPPGGTRDADIDAPEAWNETTGNSNIIVSVLDSGIPMLSGALSHPDLDDASKFILGLDLVGDGEGVRDRRGHGTHVTGIIAAETNNGVGVAGVCWNCRILVNQVFNSSGQGTHEGFRDGIIYSVDNGARLVNYSGGGSHSATKEYGVAYANWGNVLLVTISGNGSGPVLYPGAYSTMYQNVICVAATDHTDHRAPYSRQGSAVCVAAPGGHGEPFDSDDIFSTMPNYHVVLNDAGITQNYGYCYGTSMASPIVAGVAALIVSVYPLSPSEVREHIEESAEQVGSYYYDRTTGKSTQLGHGRVNACSAILWPQFILPAPPCYKLKDSTLPTKFSLFQNYPNPFNPETQISYTLPKECYVKLSIYNVKGQKVKVLVDRFEAAGHKTVRWDGTNESGAEVASGIYFYKLEAGDFSDTKKMVLMR